MVCRHLIRKLKRRTMRPLALDTTRIHHLHALPHLRQHVHLPFHIFDSRTAHSELEEAGVSGAEEFLQGLPEAAAGAAISFRDALRSFWESASLLYEPVLDGSCLKAASGWFDKDQVRSFLCPAAQTYES